MGGRAPLILEKREAIIFDKVRHLLGRPAGEARQSPAAQAEVHRSRGNALLAEGKLTEAAESYHQACAADPGDAASRVNLGYVLLEQGLHDAAANVLREALALSPASHDAMYMMALAQAAQGRREEAETSLRRALEVAPDFEFAQREHVRLLGELGRFDDALASCDAWLRQSPANAEALLAMLQVHVDARRWKDALDQAARLRAAGLVTPHARRLEARALLGLDRHDAALALIDSLLEEDPDDTEALVGKGTTRFGQGRYEEALGIYARALALDPSNAEALTNTGACYERLNQFERAMEFHEQAMLAQPDYRVLPGSVGNMASTLLGLVRVREALDMLNRGLANYPDDSDMHWNRAIALLLLGELDAGWPEYEWRWKRREQENLPPRDDHGLTPWTGQPVEGRSILLMPEQGLGDTINFMRYAPLLAKRGARVVFCVPEPLQTLVAHQLPGCEVVRYGQTLPATDYVSHTVSVPGFYGTPLDGVPPPWPIVQPDPERVKAWQARLGPRRRPRIGIVWSGSTIHKNDINRSITLTRFLALQSDGWDLVSLQKEVRAVDEEALRASGVFDSRAYIGDFADTAALIDNVDLVISVDTSVAHLAGTMGKPLWVLLPFAPDWRWMLDRSDTPWYPSARLFRQDATRTWEPVIEEVAAALRSGQAPWA